MHEYAHGVMDARPGGDRRGAPARVGVAGSERLPRRAAHAVPAADRRGRRRPRRRDRHRHRLHRVDAAAGVRRRHAGVRAAGVPRPAARLREAVEAPRRPAARRPDQRRRRRLAASRGCRDTAASSPASGSTPRRSSCSRRIRRSTSGWTTGSRPPTGSSGSCAASTSATPAPPATRGSGRTAPTRRRTSKRR